MSNHYEVLGVEPEATDAEIKAAYRFGVKAFHPDKFKPDSDDALKAQTRFQRIVEAYTVLSDPRSRAEYDRFAKYTSETTAPAPVKQSRWDAAKVRCTEISEQLTILALRRFAIPLWTLIAAAILFAVTITGWLATVALWRDLRPEIKGPHLAILTTPIPRSTESPPIPDSREPYAHVSPTASLPPIAASEPKASASPYDKPQEVVVSESQSTEDESDSESADESEQLTGPNEQGEWRGVSPDGKLVALSVVNAEQTGTRVAILTVDRGIEKPFAQHFFTERLIAHIAWSPDSKFLLFTTTNTGGHSAWHYAAFVFSVPHSSFHKLDDDIGDVVRPKFDFDAPNKALLTIRMDRFDDGGPAERDVVVPLDKISFSSLPRTSNTESAATPNFIRNGDFSLGLAFWNALPQASAMADPKNPENDALSIPIIEGRGVISQNLLVPPKIGKLQLTFRVYQSNQPQFLTINVAFFDSDGKSRQVARKILRSKESWNSVTIPLFDLGQEMRDALNVEVLCPNGTLILVDDFVLAESKDNQSQSTTIRAAQYALKRPAPEYPITARQRRATGSGLYLLRVDIASGGVKEVTIEKTTGDRELDNAAMTAFRKWRFKPGSLRSLKQTQGGPRSTGPGEAVLRVPATFAM